MAVTVLVSMPKVHLAEQLVDQWEWLRVRWALMAWEKVRRIASLVLDSNRPVLHAEQSHLWQGAHNLSGQLVEWLDLWCPTAVVAQWVFEF